MMLCVFRVRGAKRRAFRVGVQGTRGERGGRGGGGRERVRESRNRRQQAHSQEKHTTNGRGGEWETQSSWMARS